MPFKITAQQKRDCSEQRFANQYRANAIAQAPRGTIQDFTNSTPSKIMPCTFNTDSIIANQDKQAVMAAQGIPPPKRGVRNAPVFVCRKQ